MSASIRRLLNAGLALAVVAAVVAGAFLLLRPSESASADSAGTTRTVAARTGSVEATVTADGSVQAVRQVAANFTTSGTVATLTVDVGDTVTKGQVIATLDTDDLERSLELAEASLDAAEASLESAQEGTTTTDPQTGTSTTTVSSSQVAQAESQVLQAEGAVDDAESALAGATLRAPIAGTVLEVNGIVGSAANGGGSTSATTAGGTGSSDFVVIANLARLEVAVSFSEADVADLAVGQAATVTFPALDGVETTGTITSIDPTGSTSNSVVTYGAVVRLSEAPAKVRLGQSASVTITTGSATDVLVVPSAAVTTSGGVSTVTVVAEDGAASVTTVEVGVVGDAWTEVVSGLVEGDQVQLSTSTDDEEDSGFPAFPGGGAGGGGAPPAGAPAGPGGA
jgi:macrolide-specific efflux system membrane fusion protein